jgi:hypothetical protein
MHGQSQKERAIAERMSMRAKSAVTYFAEANLQGGFSN